MSRPHLPLLGFALLGAIATSSPEDTAPPPVEAPAPIEAPIETQVARLVDAIEANPDQAGTLLKQAGMTEAQLKAHLYAIARDPGRTQAYEEARASEP